MSHCQICLCPLPQHAVNCPVATGDPIPGSISDQQAEYAIDHALKLGQQQLIQSGMMGAGSMAMMGHNATELRLEWLEKEVHSLRARIAKLERDSGSNVAGPLFTHRDKGAE